MMRQSMSKMSSWRTSNKPPSMRRLSSSAYSTDEPIPAKTDEYANRPTSWVLPGRVDELSSHYIAQSKWGIRFERLIMPFSPGNIEGWAVYMLVVALVMTPSFGVHRLLYGWWDHRMFPLQVANFVLESMGCQPLFGGEVVYGRYPSEEQSPGTDLAFALHIIAGMLWLFWGFLLFFTVNKISKRAHRRLAYVSGVFLLLHLTASAYNLYVNTVKHPPVTRMLLLQENLVIPVYILGGVWAARKKEFVRHQDIMVRAFTLSVDGAGTIRVTAYIIWMIGRLFDPDTAAYFDTGACFDKSAASPMGINAHDCQPQYLVRLLALRLVTCYHHAMYLRIPEKVRDSAARAHLREEIQSKVTHVAVGIAIIVAAYLLDYDLIYLQKELDKVPPGIQFFAMAPLALKCSYDGLRNWNVIPGRTSLLVAMKTASQQALEELDFSDSDTEDFESDSGDSDKEKKD